MKHFLPLFLLSFVAGCADGGAQTENAASEKLQLTIGDRTVTATLVDNSSTAALRDLLAEGAVTVDMRDYASFEKVGALPQSLPTNDVRFTTAPGDLILYQGRNFVIYYGTNTWSFTRLGKIDGLSATELRALLGTGDVRVTLSLPAQTGIEAVTARRGQPSAVYTVDGRRVTTPAAGLEGLPAGVYVVDGRKVVVR